MLRLYFITVGKRLFKKVLGKEVKAIFELITLEPKNGIKK